MIWQIQDKFSSQRLKEYRTRQRGILLINHFRIQVYVRKCYSPH